MTVKIKKEINDILLKINQNFYTKSNKIIEKDFKSLYTKCG